MTTTLGHLPPSRRSGLRVSPLALGAMTFGTIGAWAPTSATPAAFSMPMSIAAATSSTRQPVHHGTSSASSASSPATGASAW